MRRGDGTGDGYGHGYDRAVTVQIGAILLLAILFSALALYQINVVPAENEAVEFDHSQQVQNELQELRNAIQNVGSADGFRATSVTLGTQYSPRTMTVNPSNPQGTLETTGERPFTIENASLEGDYYRQTADGDREPVDVSDVVATHNTTTVAYEPDYNEYRNAPTTRLEHSLAFNDFGERSVPLRGVEQRLVSNDSITVALLEGDLSESTSGAVTVDAETVSGPSDPIELAADGGNVTVSIPTDQPERWNETLGAASASGTGSGFDVGEAGVRVVGYDRVTDALTIEFREDTVSLRIARVGVGEYDGSGSTFDIRRADGGGGGGDGDGTGSDRAAYLTEWDETTRSVTVGAGSTTESLAMRAIRNDTGAPVERAQVSYAITDPDDVVASFDERGRTNASGQNQTALEFDADAVPSDGTTVTAYTASGGTGDRLTLEVSRSESGGGGGGGSDEVAWSIADDTARNAVQYDVSYEVTTADSTSFDRVEVEFANQDSGTTTVREGAEPRGTLEYSEGGAEGDTYDITITAYDDAGEVIDQKTATDTADGSNPDGNDDLSSPSEPQLTGSRVDDWSQPNDNSARYFASYDVANRESFDRVEVRFRNRDSGAITTETATDPRGRVEFSGNRIDAAFEIEFRVYDTDGVVVDRRTVEDTADGTNPSGNDELATETSPQFESVSVTDAGNNGQSRYDVDYRVDDGTNLDTVWVEFRNLDNAWATEIDEQSAADGEFSHSPGGGTGGDDYEITLLAFDDEGAVVDRWYEPNP
ncbi:hypothetical protein [Halopiger xanaduensis]|uniref:PKD domain containing protein n=1 Tax=Halopiger xanaduensis (strain DSM 18323 / JCM 14033 / SH-6) TaxID=797210 RepID=F8D6X9_HALXS|nr:hypothetical protein [Halopiger xanaduensis]AEH35408.1 hypothetical protein Halxa_0769 [Halopiger xanaduensis SH-6]